MAMDVKRFNPYASITIRVVMTEYGTLYVGYSCNLCRYDSVYSDGRTWPSDDPQVMEKLLQTNEGHLSEVHNLCRQMFEVL